jgi:pimeloyl-ACP methyl ester carboxylesterase
MPNDGRYILLIHGAWQGSWGWRRLIPLLEAREWRPIAVDLPGNGVDRTPPQDVTLDLCVEHVLAKAEGLDSPLTIVGHSGGGLVASQVGEAIPERIGCLVYLAGMMLPNGVGFADIISTLIDEYPAAIGIGRHLIWSDDHRISSVPPDAATDIFYHDCDPSDARWAADQLKPQPDGFRSAKPTLSPDRYGAIPRIYMETAFDRSVIPQAQQLMQRLSPGALRLVLESGHAPQLAQPERVADLLDRAIRDTRKDVYGGQKRKTTSHLHQLSQSTEIRS